MSRDLAYHKTVLDNGLRVVTEKIPSARSVAVGVWIDVGSRDEHKEENGISHFTEHMLFKGTKKRTAKEIASYLEALGGTLNAFTSREQTCYHATVLDQHLPEAIEILSDIIMHSSLGKSSMEREKSVVAEEISEVDETPSDLIHELFSDCFWRGHPLGWPIMGSKETVRSFSREKIQDFMNKHYRAGRIVISAAGNISHKRLTDMISKSLHFSPGETGRGEPAPTPNGFSMKFFRRKANQTHFCLGFPGIKFNHPMRNTILALHTILGSGMSSILFQKIREEKGIAYTVFTFPDFYRDNGLFGAYLAADKSRLHAAVEIILKEFQKIKKERIENSKLDQLKSQMKGNLILSMESTNGRMNRLGRNEILSGKYVPVKESIKNIDKIKSNDMIEAARELFKSENMTITSLGAAGESDLKNVDWSLL